MWMCELHNTVNKELGKKSFPCTPSALDKRWRTGRPDCWGQVGADGDTEVLNAEESLGQESLDGSVGS